MKDQEFEFGACPAPRSCVWCGCSEEGRLGPEVCPWNERGVWVCESCNDGLPLHVRTHSEERLNKNNEPINALSGVLSFEGFDDCQVFGYEMESQSSTSGLPDGGSVSVKIRAGTKKGDALNLLTTILGLVSDWEGTPFQETSPS